MPVVYDLVVIGGGINGCGIARDATGRGLKVLLCEMNDLASGTSSWSTKLIHGGLRYLEHYEFRLVREALMEREVLWKIAPHIIRPLRFVLPHQTNARPAWLLRLGLFLYDNIGGRKLLPGTRTLDLRRDSAGRVLAAGVATKGFEYSDCSVDDARLVVLNARDAANRGAEILTRSAVVGASRSGDHWNVDIQHREDGAAGPTKTVHAKTLINATGPWVGSVLGDLACGGPKAKVRLVQGSHIVVPRLYEHDRAYMLQNHDGRIIFTIPYEDKFTLIGTTDHDYTGDPSKVKATDAEIRYLCDAVSGCFVKPVTRESVVWSYSGVRPLYDDGATAAQEATRDYVVELDAPNGAAPLLSIFGGKITTYRRLAEAALQHLEPYLPVAAGLDAGWTAHAPLPGGDHSIEAQAGLADALIKDWPFLSPMEAQRLAGTYGTNARDILGGARERHDLGFAFGAGLSEREVVYLFNNEWAQTGDDILWRRTKLGLHMTRNEAAGLATWLEDYRKTQAPGSASSTTAAARLGL